MHDEREVRPGFLPPKAPEVGVPSPYAPPARVAADRPVFVAHQMEMGPRSGMAMAGTIIGAISLLLLVLSLGLWFPVTGCLSLSALVLGLMANQRIRQRGEGRAGQARAAMWVGGIGIALSVAALIVWAALDASGFQPEDLEQWLRDRLDEQRSRQGGGPRDDVEA